MTLINRDIPIPLSWPPPCTIEGVHGVLDYARLRDPVGHRVHAALAMLYLLLLPLWTAPKDFALALLVAYTLLRLPNIWRCYTPLLRDRFVWAFLAWGAIHALSISWSADSIEGWTELKAFRVIVIPIVLWPVLDRLPRLIGAFLVGVFILNLFQFSQLLGWFGMELKGDDRARGLVHPIHTAAFCLAALTWYIVAIVCVREPHALRSERTRAVLQTLLLGIGGLVSLCGLVFAGSRGVWVAAAVVIPLMLGVLFVRRRVDRRGVLFVLGCAVVAVAIVGMSGGGSYMASRLEKSVEQYRAAVEHADYSTSVGLRVLMSKWSREFILASPIYGHGAGSFRAISKETPEFEVFAMESPGRAEKNKFTPAHPHNAYLHVLVTTGVLGFIPFVATLCILCVRAWRESNDHLFAGAAFFVMVGWLIGTLSDCYNLNGDLFGLLAVVVAITLPHRLSPAEQDLVE